MKKDCTFEQKQTVWKKETDKTPQGYPMEIEVCQGCGVRVLLNDPQADFIKAGGKVLPEHQDPDLQ